MLAEELRSILERSGYAGDGGQKRFRLYMAERHGMSVSAEAVSAWLRGDRRPRPCHLIAILDAFAIHGPERERLLQLAWGRTVPDTSNRPSLAYEDQPTEGA